MSSEFNPALHAKSLKTGIHRANVISARQISLPNQIDLPKAVIND